MKRTIFTLIIAMLLLPAAIIAQIVYLDTTGIGDLRKTTTLFVVPEADSVLKAAYQQAISNSWKFTPYKIISVDELAHYADKKGYSFFCELCFGYRPIPNPYDETSSPSPAIFMPYSGNKEMHVMSFGSALHFQGRQTEEGKLLGVPKGKGDYSYYSLFTKREGGADGEYLERYADIKIGASVDFEYYTPIYKKRRQDRKLTNDPFWNPYWNPGLLKMYLHMVSNDLDASTNGPAALYPFLNSEDTPAMSNLVTDTLYIPNYIETFISPAPVDHLHKRITDEDVANAYPYPHRMVTSKQLSDLLLNSGRAINFLTYSPYYPSLLLYNGEKRAHTRHRGLLHPDRCVYKGIKVYNSEKGVIYANYPVPEKHIGSLYGFSAFSENDLKAVAKDVK